MAQMILTSVAVVCGVVPGAAYYSTGIVGWRTSTGTAEKTGTTVQQCIIKRSTT